jgi:hypothetical protein
MRESRNRRGSLAVQFLPQARTKPRIHRHQARSQLTIPTKPARLAQRNTLLLENYKGFEILVAMTMAIKALLWSGDGAGGIFEILVLHLKNDTVSHPKTEPWRHKDVVLWVLITRVMVHCNYSFGGNSWIVLKKGVSSSSTTLVTAYNSICCYNSNDSLSYQTFSLERSFSIIVWMFRLKAKRMK